MTRQAKSHLKDLLPLIFSLVVILIVVVTIPLSIVIKGFAAESVLPQNVVISNVTSNSFSVTFVTTKPVLGSVSYGQNNKLAYVALDNSDLKPVYAHLITVNYLEPGKSYDFIIRTDNAISGNGGKSFNVQLPNVSSETPPTPQITYAMLPPVPNSDYSDSVVLLQSGEQYLATRPDKSGKYLFTYTNLVDKNGKYSQSLPADAKIIYFIGPNGPYVVNKTKDAKREIINTESSANNPEKLPSQYQPKSPDLTNFGVTASPIEYSLLDRLKQFVGNIFSTVSSSSDN